jgi:hypothetical protein
MLPVLKDPWPWGACRGVGGGGAVGGPLLQCELAPVFALRTMCSIFCGSSQQVTVLGVCGASLAVAFGPCVFTQF